MNDLLKKIAKINSILLNESELSSAINQLLRELGTGSSVDRAYVFKNKEVNGELRLFYSYEWCNNNITPYINEPNLSNLSYKDFPGLLETFLEDRHLYGLVKDSNNPFFREVMELQGIISYLFVPIYSKDFLWGWMGYDNCSTEYHWTEEEADALHSVAKNIGLRIIRDEQEREKRKLLERFELTVDASQQGLWEWNILNNSIEFSANYMKMLGYTHHEYEHTYEFWATRLHPEDRIKKETYLKKYLSRQVKDYNLEFRMKHKNGYYKWIKSSGIAKWNEKNEAIYLIGTHIDISEIKYKQEIIEAQKNEYDFLVNNLNEVVFRLDEYYNILFINKAIRKTLGYQQEECLNFSIKRFIKNKYWNEIERILSYPNNLEEQSVNIELEVMHKNKSFRWADISIKKIQTKEGQFFLGSLIDIDDKKKALIKEKELYDLKKNFIAVTSHQFRTPLTIIQSNIEILELKIEKEEYTKDFYKNTETIKKQIGRLTDMMNNMLLIESSKFNQIGYKLEEIELLEFIQNIISVYFSNEKDGRIIELLVQANNLKIKIDDTLFTQILINIISNAFKYSRGFENPQLIIKKDDNNAQILIKDSGIGIPEEDMKNIFTSFYRAKNSLRHEGTGLGLLVAKQFVELLNGNIKIESVLNVETKVILSFPAIL
ncbi:MAG: PAS domain-containing protein [Sphingobacteriia bacterium]